jgi:non-specific serine/threonine protein kinase/serine/threonine-protein kinase
MTGAGSDLRSLFCEALDRATPLEQAEFLDRACAGRPELRARVEALLRAHREAASFLGEPSGPGGATAEEPLTERPGTVIGSCKLLELIGEGGMGEVWMAEQREPMQRKVALKILKAGMDSRQVVARFEQERQALALMDHPNIAKVFDGGTTAGGRPYFVMELVKGVPITRYCDEHRLTPRERLGLFLPVCQAIQHAHTKGIIHRDVKPANVLVAPYDGRPVPKVIDFGVAKATGQRLTERTLFTGFGAVIGTLEYMSPEQAELNNQDIDTRSDIYALGVLLYELLTGTTPLSRERVKETAFTETLRLIREEEPPRPSTRLSESKDTLASISAQRHMEPARLTKEVRGELDWIVMKALEKDRNRRYETANTLAQDVDRYLADEPVLACPPSVAYRFRKLARRNKVALTTAALVGLALVVGTAVSTWQAVRATRAETEARHAQGQVTKELNRALAAEKQASAEKANTQAALRFLLADVLEQADPYHEPDRDLKVRTLVDRAASRLEANQAIPPLVHAAIGQTMGRIYLGLGELRKAEGHLAQAYEMLRQHAGEDHAETLDAAYHLAELYYVQSDYAKAEPLFLRALDGRRRLLGDEDPATLQALSALGFLYVWRDEPERAEPLFIKGLQASRPRGDRDLETLSFMHGLAITYTFLGRYPEALEFADQALKGRRVIQGDKHPDTLITAAVRAALDRRMGRLREGEERIREVCRLRREVLGELHPHTLASEMQLALVYLAQGKRTDAEPLWRKFREQAARQPDRVEPSHIWGMSEVGLALLRQRDFAEAASFLRFYLDLAAKKQPDGWRRYSVLSALGACLLGQKKYAEAEPLLLKGEAGLRQFQEKIPAPFRQTQRAEALRRLVQFYEETAKPHEAAKWRKELADVEQTLRRLNNKDTEDTQKKPPN